MKKITIVSIFFLAVLASCKKDCETNHTATLKITNAAGERIYVSVPQGDLAIEPDHVKPLEIDLDNGTGQELIYQTIVEFRRESSRETRETMVVIYNQCQTTELTIK